MAWPSPSTSIAAEGGEHDGPVPHGGTPVLTCDVPWPCATAQRQLLAEYDGAPTSPGLYLAACMVEAAGHLPDLPSGELYARFLGWMRCRR